MENFRETLKVKKERALLVGAIEQDKPDTMDELQALAESAGAIVVDRVKQQINRPNPALYIGRGKAEIVGQRVKANKANVVIFDNDLLPNQIRELEKIVEVKVLDRSELILDIFATNARTKQAKLQVSLAQLEYTYPRLTRMWSHLDTVKGAGGAGAAGAVGGIGTRGTGEKQLEIDRRLVNKRITELKRELEVIDKRKMREIESRGGQFKVGLVGYTNTGKSTLLNKLTGSDVVAEDRLFATLDTRTRRWVPENGIEVLLSDTVGFVRNLPHHLVESFKATLEEAVYADLLLHVIDVSNDDAAEQIEAVNNVLAEIGCKDKPVLQVLNKVDVVKDIEFLEMLETMHPEAVSVSAKSGVGLDDLKEAVLRHYRGKEMLLRVRTSAANGKLQSYLRAFGEIVNEDYTDGQAILDVKIGKNQLAGIKKLGAREFEVLNA